ncbi:hypothetical protein Pint_12205 [Pistacia integerrima]|uniref:Uncharacterized protein n=1 Tax=Pistacia integerrima TaxID=434235 RepID=A0ACC0XHG9_9ROSI|nr:hypothetical protein Pint_12205 [Pistacia integerrima]
MEFHCSFVYAMNDHTSRWTFGMNFIVISSRWEIVHG